jgi:hypothetical protein
VSSSPDSRGGHFSISTAAFVAIASTLPKGWAADADGNGGYLVALERRILDRLPAVRRSGESYSDAILKLAAVGHESLNRLVVYSLPRRA